jgi:uncharacterized membrane protein HdeD (DUF308 family)
MAERMSLEEAAGAMRAAMRETVRRHSLWYLVQGVLMVLAGVMALLYPLASSVAVVLVLGWLLIVSGVFQGISLIGARNVPHFWPQLISVVLAVVVGLLFLANPGEGLLSLTLLLIVLFMVQGISRVIFALTIRPLEHWGLVLASGIVSIVLAVILWSSMPVSAHWLLGLLVGLMLISEGAALAMLALQVRKGTAGARPAS